MKFWPKHPLIYEINAWVWLDELSRREGRSLTLATVPVKEWDRLASLGFNAIWLMGVWERSSAGIGVVMQNHRLLDAFRRALPDFSPEDVAGSPYCVRRYVVDERLGGPEALAAARRVLRGRGLRLILDFVPNHVAPDHPWVFEYPEYFISGDADDFRRDPAAFFEAGGNVFACGKDPYFPAWPDVLQLNAFHEGLRAAVVETLTNIAGQCDGVRCDMAMLLLNSVFGRTWGLRAGSMPEADFWPHIIRAVKEQQKEFCFIAEAYWDLEWELQQQGFDYCYDKRLYDRLEHDPAESVRLHLYADLVYQERLVRFIENHDEPRAAAAFTPEKHRTAAVTALTLPGAGLVHEGQTEGRRVHLPIFLGRRPEEPVDTELRSFYQRLLEALHHENVLQWTWRLCARSGWADNDSNRNLVSWCWHKGDSFCLIAVNLSGMSSQGLVQVPLDMLPGKSWRLKDVFTSVIYERHGDEMSGRGLYVDLPPWGFHFFVSVQG
ncbi:MAG: alpha-amylase family glycosyl hydrolase [Nitrospirota bacterium]|nr:alpha-amylase family glycosyl hydrolase [Nitrospirota bacterium]